MAASVLSRPIKVGLYTFILVIDFYYKYLSFVVYTLSRKELIIYSTIVAKFYFNTTYRCASVNLLELSIK